MPESLQVRRIREADAGAVVDLWDRMCREVPDGGPLTPAGRRRLARMLAMTAWHRQSFCLVAVRNDDLITARHDDPTATPNDNPATVRSNDPTAAQDDDPTAGRRPLSDLGRNVRDDDQTATPIDHPATVSDDLITAQDDNPTAGRRPPRDVGGNARDDDPIATCDDELVAGRNEEVLGFGLGRLDAGAGLLPGVVGEVEELYVPPDLPGAEELRVRLAEAVIGRLRELGASPLRKLVTADDPGEQRFWAGQGFEADMVVMSSYPVR